MTKPLTPNELKLSTEQRPFHAATLHLASIDAGWRQLIKQVGLCTHLPKALSAKEIAREGQRWSPYRTIAAWYLWRVPRDGSTKGWTASAMFRWPLLIPAADASVRGHQHSP